VGTKLTISWRTIDHHWTKSLLASRRWLKLYVGSIKQQHHRKRNRSEYERAAILGGRPRIGRPSHFRQRNCNPTGLQWEPETGKLWAIANDATRSGPIWFRII